MSHLPTSIKGVVMIMDRFELCSELQVGHKECTLPGLKKMAGYKHLDLMLVLFVTLGFGMLLVVSTACGGNI
jgi:hypothetical protein